MGEHEPHSGKLSGFKCPWDSVQVTTWILYFASTGWTFYLAGSDRGGLSDSNAPLFVKIVLTLFTCTITAVCAITDPTDELFYLDWNGEDSLKDNKYSRNNSRKWEPEKIGYCEFCERNVLKDSKHCKLCNRCIREFDHHCRFINLCIGEANYPWFVTLMVSAILDLVFMTTIASLNISHYSK